MSREARIAERPGPRALLIAATVTAILVGCGSESTGGRGDAALHAGEVRRYLARVEPIRLAVNRLLDRADPILNRYRRHRLGAGEAERRMRSLEVRFAGFTARINAFRQVPSELAAAQRAYAHTYLLEDAYLKALTAALPGRSFDDLPHTEAAQRAAIVAWRTRLEAVARRLDVKLPADLGFAGRGEIAPSPLGS